MVAARHAAADLQIDDAPTHAVAANDFVQHDAERGRLHRHGDAKLGERELKPRHMPALVDQVTAPHLADFIDAVGELIAAVLDVDARGGERNVAAVDIGDAGHRCSLDAALMRSLGVSRCPAP